MITLKKTKLNQEHKNLNARLVDFAGFEMPVQYQGIIAEHNAVRNNAGLFDVSHMGEFLVSGEDAESYLNYLVPNDISKLNFPGKGLYTQICNEDGGTIDDLIIYKRENDYLVVVNASNIDKDWNWFNQNKNSFNVSLKNISENISLIAIQGPKAEELLGKSINKDLSSQAYFEIKKYDDLWIARTGYTGEDGFEVFIENDNRAVELWKKLIDSGVTPCGLGARDTLRLEVVYPLYGHELDDETSPLEAGLGWSVKLDKPQNFIGKKALLKQKSNGLNKKMVCLKINSKQIARQGYEVCLNNGEVIGTICSGSQGITIGYPIATAYVPIDHSNIGQSLSVKIREKLIPCDIVKRPFYKKSN